MPKARRKMGTKVVSRSKKKFGKVQAWRNIRTTSTKSDPSGISEGRIVGPDHTRTSWRWRVKK